MTVSGPADLLSTVTAMQAQGTQQSLALAATKQAIRSEKAVASLVADVASAAAQGTGQIVDRRV